MPFSKDLLTGASGNQGGSGFYSHQIEQSARFDRTSQSWLERDFGTVTAAKWTVSLWFKRAELGYDYSTLIGRANGAAQLYFSSDDALINSSQYTNTVAGLELAMDMLRRKKNTNKQIFMITDGKPSCLKLPDGTYYKNSVGLDETIVEKCYNMAQQAKKLHVPITTFMIAQDPYLKQFVREFTAANQGKAFFTGLKGLGEMIFEDYEKNRKKRLE